MRKATLAVMVLTLFAISGCKKSSSTSGDQNEQQEQKKQKQDQKDKSKDKSGDSPSAESSGPTVQQGDDIMKSMDEAASHGEE